MNVRKHNINYLIDNLFEFTLADELMSKLGIDISGENSNYSACIMPNTVKTNLQDNKTTTVVEGVLTISNKLDMPMYHYEFKYSCSEGDPIEALFKMKLKETFSENIQ